MQQEFTRACYTIVTKLLPMLNLNFLLRKVLYFGGLMDRDFKRQKRRFKNSLEPIMVMLLDRRNQMDHTAWSQFIERTMNNILKNPNEFVVDDFSNNQMTQEVVKEIFNDFFKETQTRKVLPK
jgi:hypothetical protein